jgi:hypothetical protein
VATPFDFFCFRGVPCRYADCAVTLESDERREREREREDKSIGVVLWTLSADRERDGQPQRARAETVCLVPNAPRPPLLLPAAPPPVQSSSAPPAPPPKSGEENQPTDQPANPSSLSPARWTVAAGAPGSNPRPSPRARGWITTSPLVIRGELRTLNTAPGSGSRAAEKGGALVAAAGDGFLFSRFGSVPVVPVDPQFCCSSWYGWGGGCGNSTRTRKLLLPAAPLFGGCVLFMRHMMMLREQDAKDY